MLNSPAIQRLHFVPLALLVIGLALTYALQDAERKAVRQELQKEFEFRVGEIVTNINERLNKYEQILEGASGLFAASSSVERSEFAEYVRALRIDEKYPGIQGVGFAKLIKPEDRTRHVAEIRAQGFSQYDISPPGIRDTYTSIVFLEPFNWRNQRAFGYDMFSEPVRRAAMEKARDEGRAIMSGKVRLKQEIDQAVQAGFLMYVPIYGIPGQHQTLEGRRANLIGWSYAPFRMNDLMQGVLGQHFGELSAVLDLEIYDSDGTHAETLMFDSNKGKKPAAPQFKSDRTLDLFGHQWTISVRSLPAFDMRLNDGKADLIALAGMLGSAMLALVAWLLVTARTRALALAQEMTADLRRSEARQSKLNRSLRLLSDCNTTLVHAEDEHRLLSDICRLCVDTGGYMMAWVGYAEEDTARSVRPVAQSGYEEGYLESIKISWADTELGRGPTGTAIRTGVPSINHNVLTNPAMAPWRKAALERGYKSSISLPLIANAKVLGALTMYAREAEAFDPEEVQLLEELAGDLAYGIVTLRTRAEHAAAKEKLAFLAQFDPLTHLPNRLLLRDRFEQAALLAKSENTGMAMLYLDMDNFRQINDTLGHDIGDKVLVTAVERLQRCIGPADTLSRLSADEFAILLTEVRDPGEIAGVINAVRDVFAEPAVVDEHSLNISFSGGISLFPADAADFDSLLKCADTAVNSAKNSGRGSYHFFTQDMNASLLEQMRLTGELHRALLQHEFLLHYQPQVDISSRRIIGAEALVRWQHPIEGLIPPGKFIPLAEHSGHIVEIGEWVLNEACKQARAWLRTDAEPLVIAVNLSALQFRHGDVLKIVSDALTRWNLPARCLELELTESILLQDMAATMKTLRGLKTLGVKLSIDDFGTGYSSLSYLKQLDIDKLKIDQSFVRDVLADGDGASIVKAIIHLGHILQLEVTAEGVESERQLEFLRQAGCDVAQGYLFSRPVPAAEFEELIGQR